MAWKASLRLHKLFVAEVSTARAFAPRPPPSQRSCRGRSSTCTTSKEAPNAVKCRQVERAERLDREGEQVLSSLANVSQRVPLLLGDSNDKTSGGSTADATLGVLAFSGDARELLLLRHFAALEKSRGFLASVVRDYAELVAKLQTLLTDSFNTQTEILDEDGGSDGALSSMRRLEWMEDVARMLQRELARKQRLVELVEYHDAARLAAVHAQWPSRSRWSNVAVEYGALRPWIIDWRGTFATDTRVMTVRAGLEPPPALPEVADAHSEGGDGDKKTSKKKNKKKKNH